MEVDTVLVSSGKFREILCGASLNVTVLPSIPNNAWTNLFWSSANYQVGGVFLSPGVEIRVPLSGWYFYNFRSAFSTSVDGYRMAQIRKYKIAGDLTSNIRTQIISCQPVLTNLTTLSFSGTVNLTTDQSIAFALWQNSGAALSLTIMNSQISNYAEVDLTFLKS